MGLNLFRYMADDQYRALKKYKWFKNTTPLNVDYPDAVGGVVLDFGGFSGGFALRCERELKAKVYCYEPVPEYQEQILRSLPQGSHIELRRHGVAAQSRRANFNLSGEATAEGQPLPGSVTVDLQSIVDILDRDAPEGAAFIALNVEGAEYEVLEKLIASGHITRAKYLRIQFHLTVPRARDRYSAIASNLTATHALAWRYPFIWESWSRRD